MNEWQILLSALLMGALLGGFFFGGLWWTVRKSLASQRPGVWLLVSLLLRMGLTLTGFYWVSAGDWQRLLMCLLGFIVVRTLMTHFLGFRQQITPPEQHHAP